MPANSRIEFQLDFKTGDIKALSSLKQDLAEIQRMAADPDFTAGFSTKEIQNMITAARTLDSALDQAFDANLNTVNIQKFNQILAQSGYNAQTLQASLATAGVTGQQAFLKMTGQLMQFNTATKQTNKFLDGIATSLFNTIKWSAMSSIVNNITGTVQKSYYYVKDLDRALNDIRIVTNKSAEDMASFAEEANNAAKALAVTTEDYTQGSLIYYQQGLDDETVKALTDITAKTSNVTQQSMGTVSEQLTAVWNGYQVANQAAEEGMQVYERYVDKMAAVGAATASDLEELSTAMSKVASAASSMGVDFDDLNAQIATIVSVTRQAPESVGTALKTIYARLGDLKVDGVDEFGTKLGEVSAQLQTMGIDILDTNGDMRDMSDVIAEVAAKQQTWTSAQREAAAVAMAGKRQYNNLVALFDNQDMYGEALETSMNAAGTLEKQQEIAMESLANKMDVLKATAEDLYDSLFSTDTMVGFVEAGTGVLQFLADFADGIGGLNNLLPMLGSIGLQVFSEQIGRGLSTIVINARNAKAEVEMMRNNFEQIKMTFSNSSLFTGAENDAQMAIMTSEIEKIKDYYYEMYQYQSLMTQEQKEVYNNILNTKVKTGEMKLDIQNMKEEQQRSVELLKVIDSTTLDNLNDTQKISVETKKINDLVSEITSYLNRQHFLDSDNEELHKFYNLLQSIDGISEEAFKSLKREMRLMGNIPAEKKIQLLRDELQKISKDATHISSLNQEMQVTEERANAVGQALKNNLNTEAFIKNISSAVGSFGQLAMSIQTIKNLGNIQSNEDISAGDKLLQTIINLSFALPNLIMSLNKIQEIFKFASLFEVLSLSMQSQTKATVANTAAQQYANAAKKVQSGLQQENLVAILNSITAEELEKVALGETTAAELLANKSKETGIRLSDEALLAGKAKISMDVAEKHSIEAKTAANEAFNTSLLKSPIVQFIAILAAVVIGIKAYTDHLKKLREEQIANNKEEIESIKNNQSEIESNEKLANSYMQLYKIYKENGTGKEDLYNTSLELIDIYDIENGRILALSGNYKELTKRIKEAQIASLNMQIQDAQIAASNLAENIALETSDKSKSSHIVDNHLVAFYTGDFDKVYRESVQEIFNNNINAMITGGGTGLQLSYNKDDFKSIYKYTEDIAEAIEFLEARYTKAELSSSNFYNTLKEQQKNFAESLPELESQIEIIDSKKIEQAFSQIDLSDFKNNVTDSYVSFDKIYNKIQEIREQLIGEISEDNFNKYLKDILKGYDEIPNNLIAKLEITEKYFENHPLEVNGNIEEQQIINKINSLNDNQLAQVALHIDTDLLNEELAEQLNRNDQIINFLQSVGSASSLRNLLVDGGYDSKKGFDTEKVNTFFEIQAPEDLGISQNQFNALDTGQQLQELTNKQIDYTKATEDARNKIIDSATEEKDALISETGSQTEATKALDIQKSNGIDVEKLIQEQIQGSEELAGKSEELKEALIAVSDENSSATKYQEGLIQSYKDLTGADEQRINVMGKNLAYTKKLEDAVDSQNEKLAELEAQIELATDSAITYKEAIDLLSESTTLHNAVLDDMQSHYKTLIGIVDSYNKTGKQTIDNVQTLMEMSDQYVAQLEFEGNTLSLNEEGFKALTLAKIDDLVTTEELAYQVKMNELAQIAEGNANDYAAQKEALHAQSLEALGSVAEGTAAKLRDVADSMAAIELYGSDEVTAAAEQATKAHENRLKALEGLKKQVNASSGTSKSGGMRDMMGASAESSSGSSSKDKDKKEQEDEFDRYWEIKKAIDAVDYALSKLDKDQENLFGYELINSLKQENELLAQQAANYNTLYEMQQQEAAELREQLGTMGVMFDASGAITNYAAATSSALQAYAAAIEQYNAGLIDETTLGVYEKSYENFKKLLERYDALYYKEMQDTQDKLDEIRRKELANNLKAQETEIQIRLDMEKAKRDQNDFLKDIKKDFRKIYQDLTIDVNFDEKNFQSLVNDVNTTIRAIHDVESEIDKMMSGGESSMFESVSQAQEKLKDLQEQLLEQGKDLYALYKEVQDAYIEGMDQVADKFQDIMDQYEHFNNELEYQRELIELLYGDKAYDLMNKYYEAQEKNTLAQIDSLRKQAEFQEKQFNESYQFNIDRGVDLNDMSTQTEDMRKAYDQMIEAQESLNDLILEGVRILQDQYLNSINQIIDAMDQGIQGKGGFDDMKENQEFMQQKADEFLDDVQGAYKIQTLANKIDQSINDTNSLKAQQKLQALRESEITMLREKENLTQADIDLAEARYQIALKEIALEDAQNNKTSMKLTRNEQGNWSYQYVADEEDVGAKQQDLLNSYAELYELANNSYSHSMELVMDLYEEMQEKMRALAEDTTLTEEERLLKIQELQDMYLPMIEAAAENSEIYKQEAMMASAMVFQEVCEQDETAYDNLTQRQKDLIDELKDKNVEDYEALRNLIIEGYYPDLNEKAKEVFNETNINSQTTAADIIKQQATDPGSVKNEINKAISEMQKAIQTYEKELDKLQEIAGVDFSNIRGAIDETIEKINQMDGATDQMVDNSTQYLDELRRVLGAVAEAQESVIGKILEAQNELQAYLNMMGAASAAAAGGGASSGGSRSANNPSGGSGSGNSNTSGGKGGPYEVQAHDEDGSNLYSQTLTDLNTAKNIVSNYRKQGGDGQVKDKSSNKYVFNTGGYTGSQNNGDSDGRFAMLHQKELVLNKDDTENFLSGIAMIRDMSNLNGSISNAILSAVGNMVVELNSMKAKSNNGTVTSETSYGGDTYYIDRLEFPNANDVNEIREAILSLPNLASQYNGRNIR